MKKKLLSLMVIMSLVVSMTLGVTGCGSKSSDSDKKVLKVAFECAYAPYNWTQESPEVGNGKQAVKIKMQMDMHMDMKLSLHKELQTNLVMN